MTKYADISGTIPQPFRVGGVLLMPFCLGHHYNFRAAGLPFSDETLDDKFQPEDVVVGIALCGLSYEAGFSALYNNELDRIIYKWKRKVKGIFNLRSLDMGEVNLRFRLYLKDGYRMPPLMRYPAGANSIELTSPWEILLRNRLMMAGQLESEVMNGYLPGRWYDYFCAKEIEDANRCEDIKNWRRTFYTREMAERIKACPQN
jgi:hypothetical protein